MKFLSFSWLLESKRFQQADIQQKRKRRLERKRLELEPLEERVVLAVPSILSATPGNGTVAIVPQPALTVNFSEDMNLADVQNTANYELFNAEGQAISVDTATYSNTPGGTYSAGGVGPFVVTLTYNQATPLPADVYSLFVRGDQIHDSVSQLPLRIRAKLPL